MTHGWSTSMARIGMKLPSFQGSTSQGFPQVFAQRACWLGFRAQSWCSQPFKFETIITWMSDGGSGCFIFEEKVDGKILLWGTKVRMKRQEKSECINFSGVETSSGTMSHIRDEWQHDEMISVYRKREGGSEKQNKSESLRLEDRQWLVCLF